MRPGEDPWVRHHRPEYVPQAAKYVPFEPHTYRRRQRRRMVLRVLFLIVAMSLVLAGLAWASATSPGPGCGRLCVPQQIPTPDWEPPGR